MQGGFAAFHDFDFSDRDNNFKYLVPFLSVQSV